MFGLFKSAEKKCCDEVARAIHRQVTSILDSGNKVFTKPEHMVFFVGYLETLLWGHADNKGLRGDWVLESEYKKYVCDQVTPDIFWAIYQKGEGMIELKDVGTFDVVGFYEQGKSAGVDDSLSSLGVAIRLYDCLKD